MTGRTGQACTMRALPGPAARGPCRPRPGQPPPLRLALGQTSLQVMSSQGGVGSNGPWAALGRHTDITEPAGVDWAPRPLHTGLVGALSRTRCPALPSAPGSRQASCTRHPCYHSAWPHCHQQTPLQWPHASSQRASWATSTKGGPDAGLPLQGPRGPSQAVPRGRGRVMGSQLKESAL